MFSPTSPEMAYRAISSFLSYFSAPTRVVPYDPMNNLVFQCIEKDNFYMRHLVTAIPYDYSPDLKRRCEEAARGANFCVRPCLELAVAFVKDVYDYKTDQVFNVDVPALIQRIDVTTRSLRSAVGMLSNYARALNLTAELQSLKRPFVTRKVHSAHLNPSTFLAFARNHPILSARVRFWRCLYNPESKVEAPNAVGELLLMFRDSRATQLHSIDEGYSLENED